MKPVAAALCMIAAFLLGSHSTARQVERPVPRPEQTTKEEPAKPAEKPARDDETTRAETLLHDLDEVILRTSSAQERARRTQRILTEIRSILKAGETTGKAAIDASAELVASLRRGTDKLHEDARLIADGIRFDVVPGFRATQAKIEARLRNIEATDPRREELQSLHDKSVENLEQILSSLERLDRNIESLAVMKGRLTERLSILALYKEVNLKGAELIQRLGDFNQSVEAIVEEFASYSLEEVQ